MEQIRTSYEFVDMVYNSSEENIGKDFSEEEKRKEKMMFGKRGFFGRSPVRGRDLTKKDLPREATLQRSFSLGEKRPAEKVESFDITPMVREMEKFTSVTNNLLKLMSDHINTKVVIKNEIKKLKTITYRSGQVEYFQLNTITTITRKGQEEENRGSRQTIFMVPVEKGETEMDGDKRLLAILSKLREDIEIVGTKEASLKVVGGDRGKNLRKLLEVTFRGMNPQLVLEYYKQEKIRAGTQKVIVKGGGKSYAELLKQIKGSVDTKEGISVKSAKKTRGGDLILEVAGK
ncbi:unnamed protein product [Diabrotica balteata]|uniref:Uncharacterized protein n=1 Tax=Diabrotica balteata TaxID=107213 RepID=A0A9P0DVT4_DIABA|nr:unnamed protein product [Diabrotica balteata]